MTIIRCLFRHIIFSVFFFHFFVCMLSKSLCCSLLHFFFHSFELMPVCVCVVPQQNVNALLYKQLSSQQQQQQLPKISDKSASCVLTNLEKVKGGRMHGANAEIAQSLKPNNLAIAPSRSFAI